MSSSNFPIYKENTTTCVWCDNIVTKFRDKKSEREFQISGLCQDCQDETFKPSIRISSKKVRQILGKKAEQLTDDELKIYIAKIQQLVEWILDEYEKKTFGRTIREFD